MDSSKTSWIYAGLGIAAGVGLVVAISRANEADVSAPLLRAGDRVLLLGDSLAQGLAPSLGQLAQSVGVPFAVDGRQGTRITQWVKNGWAAQALMSTKPTLTLVSLGTNDMMLASPEQESGDLAALVKLVLSSGSRIAFLAPPSMPFPDRGVRAMLDAQNQPTFRSLLLEIPRAQDGVHPTIAGYAAWAGAIWRWMNAPLSFGAVPALPSASVSKVRRRRP